MVQVKTAGTAARVFMEQPDRLCAAWRRERFAQTGGKGVPPNLADGIVEDLIRQIGGALAGQPGHPWSRTRGVLRVSAVRPAALAEELHTLRRCLVDALTVLNAPDREVSLVIRVIEDASRLVAEIAQRLENPDLPAPKIPFGGLVVELFEPQQRPRLALEAPARPPQVH